MFVHQNKGAGVNGEELLAYLKRKLLTASGSSDASLAKLLGVTQPALKYYRRELSPRQIVNLMMRYARRSQERFMDEAIVTIVEFFPIDREPVGNGTNFRIFATRDDHPYRVGLRARLEQSKGIYIFYDSRGSALYAGKAKQQSLWTEINHAFNRDRGDLQNIYRVSHPSHRVQYRRPEETNRRLFKEQVSLHDMAHYVTAYEVPSPLIDKLEALIVRSFANDLLNRRMERF